MTSTLTSDVSPTELALRKRIASRLDETRRCLESLPALDQRLTPQATTEATELIELGAALLTEIITLNASLRELDGLSRDGALGSGSVSVAVSAAADTLSLLQAQLDHTATCSQHDPLSGRQSVA